jgi:hypothetical protein
MATTKWSKKECIRHLNEQISPFEEVQKSGLSKLGDRLKQALKIGTPQV